MSKAVVLLSGGMDSATVLYHVLKMFGEVHALSFNYGSKHNEREGRAIQEIISHAAESYKGSISHTRLNLPFIEEFFKSDLLLSGGDIPEGHYEHASMARTVVPFRNGIMLSIAAGFAESIGAPLVYIGNHSGDHAIYPDCREGFIEYMSMAIRKGTDRAVDISSLFVSFKKSQIVKIGEELGVPWHLTYSCYKGKEDHCGKCGTCVERREAFELAKVKDPTIYE